MGHYGGEPTCHESISRRHTDPVMRLAWSILAEFAKEAFDYFLRFTRAFLDAADQFILLPFLESEIIVGEVGKPLFEFAFNDVPVALQCELVHGFSIRMLSRRLPVIG